MSTKPKPHLVAVREGNPGRRPLRKDLELPPHDAAEPDWAELMPVPPGKVRGAEVLLAHGVASEFWNRVNSRLRSAGLVSDVDIDILTDAAVCRAQMWVATREWSRKGSQSLPVPRPSLTQLRGDFRSYCARLYLSPGDRAGVDLGDKAAHGLSDFDRPADPRGGDS